MPIAFPQVWSGLSTESVNSRFVPKFVLWMVQGALSPTAAHLLSLTYHSTCLVPQEHGVHSSVSETNKWKRDHITVETSVDEDKVPRQPTFTLLQWLHGLSDCGHHSSGSPRACASAKLASPQTKPQEQRQWQCSCCKWWLVMLAMALITYSADQI